MTKLRASMGHVDLDFPNDPNLLEAAGKVALAHGQLELMLRMTIKTIDSLSVQDTLKLTAKRKNSQLRKDIEKKFFQRTNDVNARKSLLELLSKCEKLSDQRNMLLHNAWAISPDGSVVTKGDTHAWGKAPTVGDLTNLASEIKIHVELLNQARLTGFIADACKIGS